MRTYFLALSMVATLVSQSEAQTWPTQPIKIIVNFPAGGAADQLTRLIGQPLQDTFRQSIVIENRAGAGGNIGGDAVAKATPDGHTLLISSGGMVAINPHNYSNMPFSPTKDLVPVASVARVPFYLVVRSNNQAKDFGAFIADLRANPGKRSYGSPGIGSSPHLASEIMGRMTGTETVHIPYRGAAPALNDLLGGQIDFLFDPGIAIEHAKSGALRILAIGSPKRSPQLPDVPTLDELGLKGFDADALFGLYAPTGTPPAVIAKLNGEINRVLATPSLSEKILTMGNIPAPMSPGDFGMKSERDSERFGAIIKERGIKLAN
ncbi:Bug family tripartite tricarboxylate transporter substrate binding protein [Tardiphaga sp. 71_E8_N1_1]|uniref:Bug family tripartite tricarboxylate transporter substrate binding protein n=1 Tax=Tardiphaga sp. 71_E8_N1_1 TaxID=3240784 RepID=UPI003F89AD25